MCLKLKHQERCKYPKIKKCFYCKELPKLATCNDKKKLKQGNQTSTYCACCFILLQTAYIILEKAMRKAGQGKLCDKDSKLC